MEHISKKIDKVLHIVIDDVRWISDEPFFYNTFYNKFHKDLSDSGLYERSFEINYIRWKINIKDIGGGN